MWKNGFCRQITPLKTLLFHSLREKVCHICQTFLICCLNLSYSIISFYNRPAINASPAVVTVQSQYQQQQQETVSTTTTANGQGAKATAGGGLLTTATSTTHSPVASITIDINKLAPPSAATVPPCTTPTTNFAPSGDKEDSSLDAELLALAAQQTRSPTTSLPQTPAQQPKPECKTNPAKWSVSY